MIDGITLGELKRRASAVQAEVIALLRDFEDKTGTHIHLGHVTRRPVVVGVKGEGGILDIEVDVELWP